MTCPKQLFEEKFYLENNLEIETRLLTYCDL